VEHGTYPVVEGNEAINAFLGNLALTQRELLASMLVDAREGGVHDTLVLLHDRLALNGGAIARAVCKWHSSRLDIRCTKTMWLGVPETTGPSSLAPGLCGRPPFRGSRLESL